jgi:hypothetical protein
MTRFGHHPIKMLDHERTWVMTQTSVSDQGQWSSTLKIDIIPLYIIISC